MKIETKWESDIAFGIVAAISFAYFMKKIGSYKPSIIVTLASVCACLFYSYYRWFSTEYSYSNFKLIQSIKYADTVYLSLINLLILIFYRRKLVTKNFHNSFINDEPVGEEKEDTLGYTRYAKTIASKILISNFKQSFAIGVNGKWGYGKTSFIDLIKRELKNDSIIAINFNPWNSSSSEAIPRDFFDLLRMSIKPYHSSASNEIQLYSEKLIALNSTTITKSIHFFLHTLTGLESISSIHSNVNGVLEQVNKKLIIYIDDLDRLDKSEILEVIKLIRNTANFQNTYFIVAYDRDYIISGIRELNNHNTNQYLEKIFQLEINLPYYDTEVIRKNFLKMLSAAFPNTYHKTFEEEIIGMPAARPTYLDSWLYTMRDITRLYNSMIINLNSLIGEVDFGDFLKIELLRLKYPTVFEILFRDTDKYLSRNTSLLDSHHYTLKMENENSGNYVIKARLKEYGDVEADKIVSLLEIIFSKNKLRYYNKSNLSIVYPNKFLRYFYYSLLSGNLSEVEFNECRSKSLKEFKDKIQQWVSSRLEFDVSQRFYEINGFNDRDDFEKIIASIFFYANQNSAFNLSGDRTTIIYKKSDVISKINNSDNCIVNKFYSTEPQDLKNFIASLFEKAEYPYEFEGELIREINSQFYTKVDSTEYILTRNEYKEIAIKYFRIYLSKVNKYERSIWSFFHFCQYKEFFNIGNGTYSSSELYYEEAKILLLDFISENDVDGFILRMIDTPLRGGGFAVNEIILSLFNDWDSFKVWIYNQPESKWKYLKEFKEFFLKFEENNPKKYIDFVFKEMDIEKGNVTSTAITL